MHGGAYRVRGKVGEADVDLTITPIEAGGAVTAPKTAKPRSDPKRVERIRTAKMPPITRPVEFHTPEADAILSALEVFPPDHPFNQLVDDWPVHLASKKIIASIGPDKPLRYNPDMGFVLVPPTQKKVDVRLTTYSGESDRGPFPVPDNATIEGWPANFKRDPALRSLTLEDVQRGIRSRLYDRGRYSPTREGAVHHFHRLLASAVAEE